jgi:hypothetical protein
MSAVLLVICGYVYAEGGAYFYDPGAGELKWRTFSDVRAATQ